MFVRQLGQGWGLKSGEDGAPHSAESRGPGEALGWRAQSWGSRATPHQALGPWAMRGGLGVVLAALKQQEVTEGFKQDKGDLFSIVKRCSWCGSSSQVWAFTTLLLGCQVQGGLSSLLC